MIYSGNLIGSWLAKVSCDWIRSRVFHRVCHTELVSGPQLILMTWSVSLKWLFSLDQHLSFYYIWLHMQWTHSQPIGMLVYGFTAGHFSANFMLICLAKMLECQKMLYLKQCTSIVLIGLVDGYSCCDGYSSCGQSIVTGLVGIFFWRPTSNFMKLRQPAVP